MIMSQLTRVTENSSVHKQHGLVLRDITTQQLTGHRKIKIELLKQLRKKEKTF